MSLANQAWFREKEVVMKPHRSKPSQTYRMASRTMLIKLAVPVFALSLLAFVLLPQPAVAAAASASIGVSATVQASCLASATSTELRTDSVPLESAASNVSVKCDNPTPYNVCLGTGLVPGTIVAARETASPGSALLRYLFMSNTSGIIKRGQTVATDSGAGIRSASLQTLSVRDVVPAGQDSAAGAYVDTIIVTVTY